LTTGSIAPDFSQPDTAGNIVSLPSFKGVFVLLDFWASWCLPCRKENINLVDVYKKFGSKNFSIVSISLDSDKDAWLKAIRKDGLSWTQVSDLKGLFNKAGELYAVLGIPDNYLIDPDGKIIGRQLHGEELQKRLEDVLK
jgi:peroxiredoxin